VRTADDLAALAARLEALEAREALRDLVTNFGRAADAHCDPALLRPLFSSDAVFDVGGFGVMRGGANVIADAMKANNVKGFYWSLHYLLTPVIRLADDCRAADLFFYYWGVTKSHPDNGDRSFWVGGRYEAHAVVEDDAWRFRRLKLDIELLSPYGEGFRGPISSFDEV
jgi:hypothetical protein